MTLEFFDPVTSDSEFLFQLRNSDHVRSMSTNPEIITRESHMAWFQQRILNSNNQPFWIIKFQGVHAGFVRFDRDSHQKFFLSIAISEEFRGRGIGNSVIKESVIRFQKAFPGEIIGAMIRPENFASIRLFTKAGFKVLTQDTKFVTLEL